MMQETLARHIRRRVLTAWHDVYMHGVMKRFQMARAQGLFREHMEQRVLLIWRRYVKTQLHKAARVSAAHRFHRWSSMHMQVLPTCKHCVLTHSSKACTTLFHHLWCSLLRLKYRFNFTPDKVAVALCTFLHQLLVC